MTREEWHQLPDALKYPFAVTRYNDANDRFRLYVNVMHNGNYVAVGVDVKRLNQGRELPMLEVNSIKTVFAHHGEIGGSEKLITYDKEITPEQEALLRGLNFREYPTIQELSATKVVNNNGTASMDGKEVIISNQEKSKKRISNLLQNGVISWINKNVQSVSEAQSEESVLLDDSQAAPQADNNTASLGINSSELSESKGTTNLPTTNELGEKSAVPSVQEQI